MSLLLDSAEVVNSYLAAFASVPAAHLSGLRRRGCRIVFAVTIPAALRSPEAVNARGRPLTLTETESLEANYGASAGTVALYDPELDWLVFPTSYRARDLERAVLHETGHALTVPSMLNTAARRVDLLRGLPREISEHIAQPSYGSSTSVTARVLEVLAEAYAWLVVGRAPELSVEVLSELIGILDLMAGNSGSGGGFHFDDETGRTASRLPPEDIVTPDDPVYGAELSWATPDADVIFAARGARCDCANGHAIDRQIGPIGSSCCGSIRSI